MAIIGIDHVQLAIPEGGEGKARQFFCGLLGMTEVSKPTNLSPTGCWFECGPASLHVGIDPNFAPARKAHPALLVDDLAGLRERLEMAGHEAKDDRELSGYTRFFTQDPFGNRIEIMQRA